MSDEKMFLNGVDVLAGDYLQPPISDKESSTTVARLPRNWTEGRELNCWNERYKNREPDR